MLQLVVIDSTADSRRRLVERVSDFLRPGSNDLDFLPRISVNTISPQEISFNAVPDICLVGSHIVTKDITELGRLKKKLPDSSFVVELTKDLQSIPVIEQLVRYGADDFVTDESSANEFVRRLLVLSRRVRVKKSGQLLLVDSGKGGVGVTSIAAGLADRSYESDKSVALIDLDVDTQDLSRFLQARPFINENLQSLLSGNKPVTQEFVQECLVSVWDNEESFRVMTPLPESDAVFDPKSSYGKTFVNIIEILDAQYDLIIVDMGSIRGSLLRSLYRVADSVLYVINNDAATVHASVARLQKVRSLMSPESSLLIIENANQKHGLPRPILREEFCRAAKLPDSSWISTEIPFCRIANKWPGSGSTLYSQGSHSIRKSFHSISIALGVASPVDNRNSLVKKISFSNITSSVAGSLRMSGESKDVVSELKGLPAPEKGHLLESKVLKKANNIHTNLDSIDESSLVTPAVITS